MRLLCLSLALAIIYIMAIMHSSRVEARATTPDSSSSSSESWEIPPKPPKPPTPADLDEDAALAMPTVDAMVYWTGQAFGTQQNNTMDMVEKLKDSPEREEAVQEYMNKTLTW